RLAFAVELPRLQVSYDNAFHVKRIAMAVVEVAADAPLGEADGTPPVADGEREAVGVAVEPVHAHPEQGRGVLHSEQAIRAALTPARGREARRDAALECGQVRQEG